MVKLRLLSITIVLLVCSSAQAAELTVISTVGVRGALDQVAQDFERTASDSLNIQYGTSAALKQNLDAGQPFDVVILPLDMIRDLVLHGKATPADSATIGQIGVGVAVKSGTTKPDIGTPDALRSALLAARTIAYTKEGQSGIAAVRAFGALGITEQTKDRLYLDTRPAGGVLAVAEGKAALGIALMSEIAAYPQVALVGPLPGDLQSYVVFGVGISSNTKHPDVARAFLAFLGTTEVRRKFASIGMESP